MSDTEVSYLVSTDTGEPLLKLENGKVTALKDCYIYSEDGEFRAEESEEILMSRDGFSSGIGNKKFAENYTKIFGQKNKGGEIERTEVTIKFDIDITKCDKTCNFTKSMDSALEYLVTDLIGAAENTSIKVNNLTFETTDSKPEKKYNTAPAWAK